MFEMCNYLEAALWATIGVAFLAAAAFRPIGERLRCFVIAAVFIAFGGSDVVEAQTGAWWRPWWLLVWKGVCLAILVMQLVLYVRGKRNPQE